MWLLGGAMHDKGSHLTQLLYRREAGSQEGLPLLIDGHVELAIALPAFSTEVIAH
jgi:hypothetical protein